MPSNFDLRQWQDNPTTHEAFSRLVSGGKLGYKTMILKDKPTPKCGVCGFELNGGEKFCPECGTKIGQQEKQEGKEQEQQEKDGESRQEN